MSNIQMAEKFFCGAKIRPSICKIESNTCCYNCEHNALCTAEAQSLNKRSVKKIPLPCNSQHIDDNELCEFAC